MKTQYRSKRHKEYVGDKHGNLYYNQLKYFEFHAYPGLSLHRLWALIIMLLLIFRMDDLFALSYISGFGGLYVFYLAGVTVYLLTKKICRTKGYFLYPSFMIRFFNKRKKSPESSTQLA